jgi:Reverse transcriptase (RNA-dependent DNA polymerase)
MSSSFNRSGFCWHFSHISILSCTKRLMQPLFLLVTSTKPFTCNDPKGFVELENADKDCRLRKALCGLKRANRQWYAKMDKFLCVELGFTRNAADNCVYVWITGEKITLIVLKLVLNQTVLTCSDVTAIDVSDVQQMSQMADLSEA